MRRRQRAKEREHRQESTEDGKHIGIQQMVAGGVPKGALLGFALSLMCALCRPSDAKAMTGCV
jgi:hypothetical protein